MWLNFPVTEQVGTAITLRQRIKKLPFCAYVLHKTSNLAGKFTLLFGRVRRRNVPNFKTHVQRFCFSNYIPLFCEVLAAVAVVAQFLKSMTTLGKMWAKPICAAEGLNYGSLCRNQNCGYISYI